MSLPIDFRFSTNADLSYAFGCTRFGGGPVPWVGTPLRVPGNTYGLGMAVVDGGDLYIPDPAAGSASFVTGTAITDDVIASGASRWLLVGSAASYAAVPYDFTGREVVCAFKPCDELGNITDPRARLTVGSKPDGTLLITAPDLGGLCFATPRRRVRTVPPGLYRYDILAVSPQGPVDRVRYGLALFDEGISP